MKEVIKLSDLAKELGVDPAVVRRELRNTAIKKPGSRWEWPKDHPDLPAVRLILKARLKHHRRR